MFGIDSETAEAWHSTQQQAEQFEIWPENVQTLDLFLRCSTQWRWMVGGMLVKRTGFDYTAVASVMHMMRVPASQRLELIDNLRVMESAALEAWNV